MGRSTAKQLAPVLFWLFVIIGSYILFEITARYLAPLALEVTTELDAALSVVDQDFDGDIDKFVARESDPARIHPHLTLGWDKSPVVYNSCTDCDGAPLVVLVLGDSVTQGHGVRIGSEDYPYLMSRISEGRPVRIINAGVGGYGVDQMLQKMEALVDEISPDVIVVAYIAHDLLRPGRRFIYLRNRPFVRQTDRGLLWENPGDDADFIARYRNHRDSFATGIWLGGFIWENRRYYAPHLYRDFYEAVFGRVVGGMREMAAEKAADLHFIRLPQNFRFRGEHDLTALMNSVLERHIADPGHPVSTPAIKECVVGELRAAGHEFDIMGFHPKAAGHRAYARCIFDAVLDDSLARATGR
jgi:lysophospholipase L1-like esterase